jgi:hypothetical protein
MRTFIIESIALGIIISAAYFLDIPATWRMGAFVFILLITRIIADALGIIISAEIRNG